MGSRAPLFDLAQVPQLIRGASDGLHATRDIAMVRVMLDTGARPVELALMTWKMFADGSAKLTGRVEFKSAKRGRWRSVTLSEATLNALRLLSIESKPATLDARVFLTAEGEPFNPNSPALRLAIREIFFRASLRGSAYSIRHARLDAAGKIAAENGLTVVDLAGWSGHSSAGSVAHYVERHSHAHALLDKPVA